MGPGVAWHWWTQALGADRCALGWGGLQLCCRLSGSRTQCVHLPSTVMASPSSLQFSSCSMLASRTAKATCKITLMPS